LHTSHEEVLLLGPNALTAIIDGRGWFEEKRREASRFELKRTSRYVKASTGCSLKRSALKPQTSKISQKRLAIAAGPEEDDLQKRINRSENDREKHQKKSVKFSKLVARNALKT